MRRLSVTAHGNRADGGMAIGANHWCAAREMRRTSVEASVCTIR